MALGDVLARLSVELGLDTAAFTTGSRKAQRANKDLGDSAEKMGRRIGGATKAIAAAGLAVAGGFVIAQLKDLVKGGLDYASALGEQAQQLGVSTRALQEYRYAASQAGISSDEMDAALSKLTRSIGEAEAGSKTQAEAFAKLGISTRDANGQIKDAGDLLPEIAEKLKGLATPAERAALLVDLFGKSGQKLAPLLADGAAGVNNLRDAAQKLGIVLSDEQIQKADATADKLSALQQVLSAKIAGAVSDNTDSILELVNALIKLVEFAGKAARAWRLFSDGFSGRQFLGDLGQAGLGSAIIRQIGNASAGATAPGVRLNFTPAELEARRRGAGAAPLRSNGSLLRAAPKGSPFTPGLGPTKFAESALQFDAGRNTEALAALTRMAATAEAASGRLQPALAKLSAATAKATDDFAKLGPVAQGLFERLFPQEAAEREYEEALKALNAELAKGVISLDRYTEARRRLSIASLGGDASDDGGDSVFQNVDPLVADLDKIDRALGRLKGFHDTTADAVEVANVRIVGSFADMAQRTIGSLQGLTGAIKGGGFLDILGAAVGLFTQLGSIGAFGKGISARINAPVSTPPINGYAAGTMSAARGLALVGERGPELVRFGGGERVYPSGTGPRGAQRVEIVDTTGLFRFRVDGQIAAAAPALIDGGASVALRRGAAQQNRRLA